MTILAQTNPTFQPSMRIISSITNAYPAVVTTTFAHQYKTGTIVRFYIPFVDGMQQLNQQIAPITVTGSTTFTIPIDTTLFAPFAMPVSPPPYVLIYAQVVPIGEINDTLKAAVQNVLPYGAS